jgi:hypothetical protein
MKKEKEHALPRVPNGLAFSCRERAANKCQKPNDLAREAVSCNAGLGHPADRLYGVISVLLPIGR